MRKPLFIILAVVFLSSCNFLKKVNKVNKETTLFESDSTTFKSHEKYSTITTEKSEGGFIVTDIIPISERKLDSLTGLYEELVQKFNDGGLTKTIFYQPDGGVRVDCEAEEMLRTIIENYNKKEEERGFYVSELIENISEKQKEEAVDTNLNWTIIACFGIVVIGVLLFLKLPNKKKILDLD